MQLYKSAEAVSLSLKTLSFPEIMHRFICIFMKNHINKLSRTKMLLKEGTKIELQRDISSQGFFFPIWSISWYQWRRDVMTPGRHQCQFGSHRWRWVDINVNSHQWCRVNIDVDVNPTSLMWIHIDVNPTSPMWTELTLMTSQHHDVPASLI